MTYLSSRQISRRLFLVSVPAIFLSGCARDLKADEVRPASADFSDSSWRQLTEEEWQDRLSPLAFKVLREEATERPFTSPLNDEKRPGMYHCAGCDLALFSSKMKYDSGTGWPSFWQVLPGAVATRPDHKLWMTRTEYHCARCGGHQGHVFEDGPKPTGLRYCNNGVALSFRPA